MSAPFLFSQDKEDSKKPVVLYTSFAINSIGDIDYVKQTFNVDFYLRTSWRVSPEEIKSILPEGKILEDGMEIPEQNLKWLPKHDFPNNRELEVKGGEDNFHRPIYVYDKGYLKMDMRFYGTFNSTMDLRKFPFDEQTLTIKLEDFNHNAEKLIYEFTPGKIQKPDYEKIKSWDVKKEDVLETESLEFSEFKLSPKVHVSTDLHKYEYYDGEVFHQFKIDLKITRHAKFYITKVITILVFIVITSWGVFFISPLEIGDRLTFGITALLSIIGHNYVTNSILPRIGYLTSLDYLTLGSSLMVFLSTIHSAIVYKIATNSYDKHSIGNLVLAKKIDRFARYGFIPTFCLLIYYALSI